MSIDFAIIGGTGVYDPKLLSEPEEIHIDTPYGAARATLGTFNNRQIAFMPRHGVSHSIPPHKVNYRANIYALKELGVTQVLASAAVGSLQPHYKPGDLVIVDDFLDFTKSRLSTFFDKGPVVHVDMTEPYCHRLRNALAQTAEKRGIPVHEGGAYVCTEGPRFETPAEIRLYQSFAGAVVGMTSVPEVVLAKEAELCYATVCIVTNYAAGLSQTPLTHQEVLEKMEANIHIIRDLFFNTVDSLSDQRDCLCSTAVGTQTPLSGLGRKE